MIHFGIHEAIRERCLAHIFIHSVSPIRFQTFVHLADNIIIYISFNFFLSSIARARSRVYRPIDSRLRRSYCTTSVSLPALIIANAALSSTPVIGCREAKRAERRKMARSIKRFKKKKKNIDIFIRLVVSLSATSTLQRISWRSNDKRRRQKSLSYR